MMTDIHKARIQAIGALFIPGAFPRQEQEGTEKQLLDVYLIAVEDIHPGFVAMACKRFIQGRVEGVSVAFRPTPAQFAIEARRLRDKSLDSERLSNLRLAGPAIPPGSPPGPTPEERERGAEMLRRVSAEIRAAHGVTRMSRQRG